MTFDAYGDQATAGTRSYTYDALGRLTADTPTVGRARVPVLLRRADRHDRVGRGVDLHVGPVGQRAGRDRGRGRRLGRVLALTDAHGDVLGQFTASGTAVSGSQSYDPWGNVTATTGTMQGLLGYQSAWSDPASART